MVDLEEYAKFDIGYEVERDTMISLSNVLEGKKAQLNLYKTTSSADWSTIPVMNLQFYFVYKTPEFKVLQTFFLDVFTPPFWFASLSMVCLIVFAGWIFNKLMKVQTSMILLAVFVLTNASDLPSSQKSSFRFFLVVVGIFSFMFITAFNLFLTSFLSTQTTILPFKTIDDIAEVGTHSLCVRSSSQLAAYFAGINT